MTDRLDEFIRESFADFVRKYGRVPQDEADAMVFARYAYGRGYIDAQTGVDRRAAESAAD